MTTLSSSLSGSALRSPGATVSLPRSLITSFVPSPLASNQSAALASSVTARLAKSKRSSVGRGPSSSGAAPPSPSSPFSGSRSQASPPFTARSRAYRDSGTGSVTTRPARPSVSTTTGAVPAAPLSLPPSPSAALVSPDELPPPGELPAVSSPAFSLPSSTLAGRPASSGPNGDVAAACSGSRNGLAPYGNDRSKKCAS